MPLPNVLIIGAMKAGTTSLYMDLATHERGFLGNDKEPCALCNDDVFTTAGRAAYEAIYSKARLEQTRIDASTGYAKRPDVEGVVQRACRVLPEGFKVIYIVRHPIERIISQHHHEYSAGLVGPSIDEEVRRHPRYIHYSRYYYQIQPWIEALGRERVLVIRFEDYVNQRRETMGRVLEFLDLPPLGGPSEQGKVYNRSEGKPVKTKFWHRLQQNQYYRNWIRPLMPWQLRDGVRKLLLPKSPQRPAPPADETVAFLRESLQDDVKNLNQTMGKGAPWWNDFPSNSPSPSQTIIRGAESGPQIMSN